MRKCELCDRPLEVNEEKLCPACKSEKSHKKKRVIEYITTALVVVGSIIVGIVGGLGGGRRA